MSEHRVKVASAEEIPPGKMKRVDVEGHRLLVANIDGSFCVTDDTCTHEDASLSTGALQGDCVKCPLHGSRFNLRTGEALDEPAEAPLKTYPVRLEGGAVLVELE